MYRESRFYDVGNDFFVEVEEFQEEYPDGEKSIVLEFWLQKRRYGVKHFMFGAAKSDISRMGMSEETMIENNLAHYIEIYNEEV